MIRFSSRKFLVVITALVLGAAIAFTCDAAVLTAYATLASFCVGTYNAAHGIADSQWSKKDTP